MTKLEEVRIKAMKTHIFLNFPYLTPRGSGYTLSDFLEEQVDEKYFLSDKAVEGLMKHKAHHEEQGNGFGATIHDVPAVCESGGGDTKDLIRYAAVDTRTGSTARGQHLIRTPERERERESIACAIAARDYKGGNNLLSYQKTEHPK